MGRENHFPDAKDLSNFKFDDLVGNILTHEMRFKEKFDDSTPRRRQELALKHDDDESSNSESDDDVNEEEVAFLTKRFQKAFVKYDGNAKKATRKTLRSRNKFHAS